MDKGPRGSRTVRWGALTFDHHLVHRFDWRKSQTAGVPAPGSEKEKPLQKVTSIRVLLCLARRNDAISGMIILRPILLSLHSAFHCTVFIMESECDNRPPEEVEEVLNH